MCQAEETRKGSKITVSVSVSSWHILERRRIYASPVGMVCPKGHQETLISCWASPSYSAQGWHHAQGQTASAGKRKARREAASWAWKYPPNTQKKACFGALFILTLLFLLLLFHSTQSPPASGSSHRHQNKVLLRMSSVSAASLAYALEDVQISCQCGGCQKSSLAFFLNL